MWNKDQGGIRNYFVNEVFNIPNLCFNYVSQIPLFPVETEQTILSFQIAISRPGVEDDDKSWTTEDPPPCYADIMASPPSYSSNKNIATSVQHTTTPTLPRSGRSTTPTISSAARAATPTISSAARAATPTYSAATSSRHVPLSYSPNLHEQSSSARRQLPQIRNYYHDYSGPSSGS